MPNLLLLRYASQLVAVPNAGRPQNNIVYEIPPLNLGNSCLRRNSSRLGESHIHSKISRVWRALGRSTLYPISLSYISLGTARLKRELMRTQHQLIFDW